MARQVSRVTEGSDNSVIVPVNELPYEETTHRAKAEDISAARSPLVAGVKKLSGSNVTNWIENLMDGTTNFNDTKGNGFKLAAKGFNGSIQSIDDVIKNNAFVHRAVQRGKIKFLTEEEAYARMEELVDEHSHDEDHLAHIMESLGHDASENFGMYKIPLPEEAEPNGPSLTPEQIWKNSVNKPANPKNYKQNAKFGETEFQL